MPGPRFRGDDRCAVAFRDFSGNRIPPGSRLAATRPAATSRGVHL